MAKKKIEIKITHYGTQRADQFNANPLNPRIHPQHQRDVIRASLQRFGIISPVVVSKRSGYLIDGHERVWQALAEGDDTLVPYVEADVEEDKEAELILTYDKSTMMAEYDPVNLQLLMEQVNTDDEVLAKLFAEMEQEYIAVEDDALQLPSHEYTQKIDPIIYTPQSKVSPPVDTLCNTSRTDTLLAEIKRADIPEEVKRFLELASYRHTVFNYSQIAEYYAHAPKNIQLLMEDSALVIIDFDRAIELGYVKLQQDVLEVYRGDYEHDA